jgi:hypothetical protein
MKKRGHKSKESEEGAAVVRAGHRQKRAKAVDHSTSAAHTRSRDGAISTNSLKFGEIICRSSLQDLPDNVLTSIFRYLGVDRLRATQGGGACVIWTFVRCIIALLYMDSILKV